MKIYGQFENIRSVQNYSAIKNYTVTCDRNEVNEIDLQTTLCLGSPFSVLFYLWLRK